MKKYSLLFLLLSIALFTLAGCTKSVPNNEEILKHLKGSKVSIGSGELTVEKAVKFVLKDSKNNYDEDKSSKITGLLEFENSIDKYKAKCPVELTFEYYEEDGWKLKKCIGEKDNLEMYPIKELSDKELLSFIKTYTIQCDDSTHILQGKISENAKGQTYELDSSDVTTKITNKSYDSKKCTYKIDIDMEFKSDFVSFKGKYNTNLVCNFPNYSVDKLKISEQTSSYTCPKKMDGSTYYYLEVLSENSTIEFTLDSNNIPTEGVYKFSYSNSADKGSYKLKPTFNKETGEIILKAGDWIEKPNKYEQVEFKIKPSVLEGLSFKGDAYKVNSNFSIGSVKLNSSK